MYSQQWLLDRQDLIRERQQDLIVLTEEEYQKIFIFFSNCKLINKFKFCLQI
jgi:cyclin C